MRSDPLLVVGRLGLRLGGGGFQHIWIVAAGRSIAWWYRRPEVTFSDYHLLIQ